MYDRGYEISFGSRITPAVKNLIIANITIYILQLLWLNSTDFHKHFGLVPTYVINKFFIWQLCTYMFLHGGFFHILFNMFVLWMFGSEIERHWGKREFYKYYFITGIGAGIFSVIVQPSSLIPIVGASGALMSLLLAFGLMFPNRPIFLFPLFIPIKAKYFVVIFGILSLVFAFSGTNDGIAHFTHLGGIIVGYLYLRVDWRSNYIWTLMKSRKKRPKMHLHRNKNRDDEDFKDRIDKVLDKINEVGYNNLTEEEKEILKNASKFYLRRDR